MQPDGRQRGPSHSYRPKSDGNTRFPEKDGNYSPSARYLYGGASQPHQHQQHQQQSHRRDQFKGGGGHFQADRLAKQNDVIIRLLKEIRDRLPAPPQSQRAERPQQESRERRTAQAEQLQPPVGDEIVSSAAAASVERHESELHETAPDTAAGELEPDNQ